MSSIQSTLQTLLETEMSAGGLLANLNGVYIGGIKLMAAESYPVLIIDSTPGKYIFNGNHLLVIVNLTLTVHVIMSVVSDAEEVRDKLIYDYSTTPASGLIAFFLKYGGLTVGSLRYKISLGEIETGVGTDKGGRETAAAEIPLELSTRMAVTPHV